MKKNLLKTSNKNYEKNEKEQIKKFNFSNLLDFPEIVSQNNKIKCNDKSTLNNTINQDISFIDKVKINKFVTTIDNDIKYVKPGWVSIYKDKQTNKIIYNEGVSLIDNNEDNNLSVLNSLVNLYKYRKTQYIEIWGEDEYNKMFIIPNYDYEYFDKLDNIYLTEVENDSEYNSEDELYESFPHLV
jgi:hypothetical protein